MLFMSKTRLSRLVLRLRLSFSLFFLISTIIISLLVPLHSYITEASVIQSDDISAFTSLDIANLTALDFRSAQSGRNEFNRSSEIRLLQTSVNNISIPFRINCGGRDGDSTDPVTGFLWIKDTSKYFRGGSTYSDCNRSASEGIKLSYRDCSERRGPSFGYDFPVPAAETYKVTFYFTENWFSSAGKRIFNVSAEGLTYITNLDIIEAAGGRYKPIKRQFLIPVLDGTLNLQFTASVTSALINGIEIEKPIKAPTFAPTASPTFAPLAMPTIAPLATPTFAPIRTPSNTPMKSPSPILLSVVRINAGSKKSFIDPSNGNLWLPDNYASGGSRFSKCPINVTNTELLELYCTERYWSGPAGIVGTYIIPVVPGRYTVKLLFTELYFTTPKARLFNVSIQNTLIQSNVDIYSLAGGANRPYIISSPSSGILVTSTDSNVRIEFTNLKQYSKISAIEVIPHTSVPVTPIPFPSSSPISPDTPTVSEFSDILINAGSSAPYTDALGRSWRPDQYFVGGISTNQPRIPVENTVFDDLYYSDRRGSSFRYDIPVPIGSYEINFFFAETQFASVGQRLFDIRLENHNSTIQRDVDIFKLSGAKNTAVRLQLFQTVDDGMLTIEFMPSSTKPELSIPKINAIEVKLDKPHICHAVATGPYFGTVSDALSNHAQIQLLGSTSHTHGPGLNLISYQWKIGNKVFSTLPDLWYNFTTGETTISLTVKDDGGNEDTEVTLVTIRPFGFPTILRMMPSSGDVIGGYDVVVHGSGFNYSASEITVFFGQTALTGSSIQILNATSLKVKAPSSKDVVTVSVIIQTPLGTSEATDFNYVNGSIAIAWKEGIITNITQPTVGRFGHDRRLYVGTRRGKLLKITMNGDFTAATDVVVVSLPGEDAILGIATDPMDTKDHPDVYFTYNEYFFHSGTQSSSGPAIGGRIIRASGPNLETMVDVITGLPQSGLDHGLNAIEFGDQGQLFFTSGSFTNGGVPGKLSNSGVLKENFLSASINVAYMSHPDFNGTIRWSAPDDGNMIAQGIDLFAVGFRNPYGLMLHSNGELYASDNGPNPNYGRMSIGCGNSLSDSIDDQKRMDELNHVIQGQYYGSPNKKRASFFNDSRQCVWRPMEDISTTDYTGPMMTISSSLAGIVEFHGNHFGGQLRSNIIMARYGGKLYRAILADDGKGLIPSLKSKALNLNIGANGLDVTQAPNGNLIEMRYQSSLVVFQQPVEPESTSMIVKTVFPRRGRNVGGNPLYIYGVNFLNSGPVPSVQLGGVTCPITYATSTRIICIIPGGIGTVDVVVENGSSSSVFSKAYRYISGLLPPSFVLPVYKE